MEELCFRDENWSDVKSISDITEVKFHKNTLYQKKKKKHLQRSLITFGAGIPPFLSSTFPTYFIFLID